MIIILLALSFNGCSTKDVYIKEKPYSFVKIQQPKERTIRVFEEDEELYRAYITKFRDIINFYNQQIDSYMDLKKP